MSNITLNIVEPSSPTPAPVDPGTNPAVPNTGLFTHGIGAPEATIMVSAVLILAIVSIVLGVCMYRRHKKAGKTTKLVHIVDQCKGILASKKRVTAGLAAIALLVSAGTFIALARNGANATDAEPQAEGEDSLTVDVSDTDFTIEVGDEPVFAVLPVELTVEEATAAGYTLTAYTDSTGLVSTTNPDNAIPMIAVEGDELEALTDNTYGLALEEPTSKDDETYTTLSTDQSNPTIIKSMTDYTPTVANDTTTIYYGFYITPDTPYGTYTSSDIHYEAKENADTVIYNGNGLYFNDDEGQTTNTMKYVVGITENTEKVSRTPNIDIDGNADRLEYDTITNNVVTIPGASKLHAIIKYGTYDNTWDYLSFWQGSHPEYTAKDNYSEGIKECGDTTSDGRFAGNYNDPVTMECDIPGDSVTFGFWSQPAGGPPLGYGYYAVVTGYDENGDLIYLQGNTPVQGEYQAPAQDLPYVFLGWNKDKDATSPSYASVEDIEANLSLTPGKTTTLYAVWQHATNITFDGNGADGGPGKSDIFIAAGKSTWLQNTTSGGRPAYTKSGHYFTGWNTEPDGSGTNYIDTSFTAPIDKSENLTLYAQWQRYTTVSFDGNGSDGGSGKSDRYLEVGSSIYLCNNDSYTKTGSTFSGWNTAPDDSGTAYADCVRFTAPSEPEDITLYAQWAYTTTITFNGNGADSGSMAPQTIVAGTPQNLTPNAFAKDGYIFAGWNTNEDGSGTSYADQAEYTASTTRPENVTLYAQWMQPTMQNVALWGSTLSQGDTMQVPDTRDGKSYWVAKLADGNIWMTQNLDLDIEAGRTYTSADTDLANSTIGTTWTPTVSTSTTSSWTDSTTAPSSYDPGNLYWNGNVATSGDNLSNRTTTDPSTTSGGTHYHVGNYYNWTAAVAMNDSSSYTTQYTDVDQSICPAGWRLPTYSGDKSYQNLVSAQGLTSGTSGNIQNAPTYFVYVGYWTDNSYFVGHLGDYWFGVVESSSYSYRLFFDAGGNLFLPDYDNRDFGASLRCVAR